MARLVSCRVHRWVRKPCSPLFIRANPETAVLDPATDWAGARPSSKTGVRSNLMTRFRGKKKNSLDFSGAHVTRGCHLFPSFSPHPLLSKRHATGRRRPLHHADLNATPGKVRSAGSLRGTRRTRKAVVGPPVWGGKKIAVWRRPCTGWKVGSDSLLAVFWIKKE